MVKVGITKGGSIVNDVFGVVVVVGGGSGGSGGGGGDDDGGGGGGSCGGGGGDGGGGRLSSFFLYVAFCSIIVISYGYFLHLRPSTKGFLGCLS